MQGRTKAVREESCFAFSLLRLLSVAGLLIVPERCNHSALGSEVLSCVGVDILWGQGIDAFHQRIQCVRITIEAVVPGEGLRDPACRTQPPEKVIANLALDNSQGLCRFRLLG